MSPNKQGMLIGVDPVSGDAVPLAAQVSHPAKDKIRLTAAPGWDIALMRQGSESVIVITDGEESLFFAIETDEDEYIVAIDQGENYIEVTTRGG